MNVLPLLLKLWPLWLALLTFGTGWHVRGAHDDAKLLAQQAAAQEVMQHVSQQTETKLAAERQKYADLNQKYARYRAAKDHVDCKLPASARVLLQDITGE